MSFIYGLRILIFYLIMLMALPAISLSVHLSLTTLNLNNPLYINPPNPVPIVIIQNGFFPVLIVVAAGASLLLIPILLVAGIPRFNSWVGSIVVELVVSIVLLVLWAIGAAQDGNYTHLVYPQGCGDFGGEFDDGFELVFTGITCQELQACIGIGAGAAGLMGLYLVLLLIHAISGASKGNKVWTNSVARATFFGKQEDDQRIQYLPTGEVYMPNTIMTPQANLAGKGPVYGMPLPATQPNNVVYSSQPQFVATQQQQQQPNNVVYSSQPQFVATQQQQPTA